MEKKLFLLIFLTSVLCYSFQAVASDNYNQSDACSAIADSKKKKALFVFQVDDSKKYTWYREATPESYLEYAWNISMSNNNKFSIGLYLFKRPGQKPKEGSLRELLSYCQQTVNEVITKNGKSIYSINPNLKFGVMLQEYGLGVFINDPNTYNQILGDNPEGILINYINPDQPMKCSAKIEYQ